MVSSTDIIESGNYLEDGFDPNQLTIPHLTAILNYHNIPRPAGSKARLIEVFNDEVFSNRETLKEERRAMEGSQASAVGIQDGHTGLMMSDAQPPNVRRSSRHSSRAPSVEPPQPPQPPKLKRRRSASEEPASAVKKPSKIISKPSQPTLKEESEPSDDEPAFKPVGRKNASTNGSNRRVSLKIGSGNEESPWEDTNIFQSGNESSSPVRAPSKPRASGGGRHTKRASMSAPPEMPASPTASAFKHTPPSSSHFSPKLPLGTQQLPLKRPDSSPLGRKMGVDSFRVQKELLEEEDDQDERALSGDIGTELSPEDQYNVVISDKLAGKPGSTAVVKHTRASPRRAWFFNWALLICVFCASIAQYKIDSASVGYCDAGTSTNSVLKAKEDAHLEQVRCSQYLADLENVPTEITCRPLPPFSYPEQRNCTPCPAHAECTPHSVTCQKSFIPQPHPLGYIPYFNQIFSGVPGFGSVAFPPTCVIDQAGRMKIRRLGRSIESYLALRKGQIKCDTNPRPDEDALSQAKAFGVEINELRAELKKAFTKAKLGQDDTHIEPPNEKQFDHDFDEAMISLANADLIIRATDDEGMTYVASESTSLTIACQVKVMSRDAWEEWRVTIFSWLGVLLFILGGRRQVAKNRIEGSRISELVQTALDQLRQQEFAHYSDPVTYRYPFLSPLHLRDLVLRDEHSVTNRKRLWDKVEKVVENNANVRVNIEEVQGDEARVWRWIGGGETPMIQNTPQKA